MTVESVQLRNTTESSLLISMHENQVIIRFWILSIMLALFGLALLKIA